MKEIVIVSKGNNAVAYGEGIEIKKSGVTGISANLAVLNELLKSHISVEPGDTFRVFLMDLIQGINSGYAIDYAKTGKYLDGKDLVAEDLAGYKEFYTLYKDRLLNIRFNQVSYIPKMKDNKVQMELRSKAYALVNSMVSTNTYAPQVTSQVVDTDKELREMFDEQMKIAISKGDMDTYRMLKTERDNLKAPEVVQVSSTSSSSIETPTFDVANNGSLDDMDKDLANALDTSKAEKDLNDKPIEFNIESSGKPSWDGTEANA